MKIVLATASLLTAAALTGCGGHSGDYNKGYEIASHELVQSQVGPSLARGESPADVAPLACEWAYDIYWAFDNVNDKDDYVKGCVDAVSAQPGG
jgi:hypothetical protein